MKKYLVTLFFISTICFAQAKDSVIVTKQDTLEYQQAKAQGGQIVEQMTKLQSDLYAMEKQLKNLYDQKQQIDLFVTQKELLFARAKKK
jgi:hypothetical protein